MDVLVRRATARAVSPGAAWYSAPLAQVGTVIVYDVNEPIYCARDRASFWYQVLSGCARECGLSAGGRRQVIDFLRPGDCFGFEPREAHLYSTEALEENTQIARYPCSRAEMLAERDPHAARWIREMAFQSISRLHTRMLILGRANALAKLSAFLLDWADRCHCTGHELDLPMSRYDIADYLAVAVETVSRAFTNLRLRRIIALRGNRRVSICDRRALESLVEEPASPGQQLELE